MKFHYVRPPLDFIFKGGGIWNCLAMCRNQTERIRTPQDAVSNLCGDPCIQHLLAGRNPCYGCFSKWLGDATKPGENDDPDSRKHHMEILVWMKLFLEEGEKNGRKIRFQD